MRYAVLADVHANLEALRAVLDRLQGLRVDRIVSLGDTVGFNANPRECLNWLMSDGILGVAGNHDLVAAGLMEPDEFSDRARTTVLWTRGQLLPEHVRYVAALPQQLVIDDEFVACHANLWDASERIVNPAGVAKMFAALRDRYDTLQICFFGHTHRASAHALKSGTVEAIQGERIPLDPAAYYLFNPGSVAESRGRDRRASFAIFDSCAREVEFHRVSYDRRTARRKAVAEGLPQPVRGTRLRKLVRRNDMAGRGPHAVVLGLGVNGLGVVRALGRKGIRVVGAYELPRDIGRYSRHCRAVAFPDPQEDPDGFLQELYTLGRRLGDRPVLFPTTDVQIALVSRERAALEPLFRVWLAEQDVLDVLMDKAVVLETARRYGIGVPRTFTFANQAQLDDALEHIPLPCVVKPRYPWRPNRAGIPKVTVLHAREQIVQFLQQYPGTAGQLVFQEVIEGTDADHAFCIMYMTAAHEVAGIVTGESIHRYPPNLGVTACCVTRDLPDLAEGSERFLRGERYVGLVELEYKRDRRDGVHKLYEVNTRTWNYNLLGPAAGVDLVHMAYLEATGQPLPPGRRRGADGCTWINSEKEAGYFWKNLKAGRFARPCWRALSPGTAHSKFAFDDPLPALGGLYFRMLRPSAGSQAPRPQHAPR